MTSLLIILINDSAARVNRFIHDHTGSNAGTALENQDEGKQLVYLQAMASTKAVFELPSLEGLAANGPVIVNRAEVVLPYSQCRLGRLPAASRAKHGWH